MSASVAYIVPAKVKVQELQVCECKGKLVNEEAHGVCIETQWPHPRDLTRYDAMRESGSLSRLSCSLSTHPVAL